MKAQQEKAAARAEKNVIKEEKRDIFSDSSKFQSKFNSLFVGSNSITCNEFYSWFATEFLQHRSLRIYVSKYTW